MSIRLHHFFVQTAPGAPEGDQLIDIGMVEGTANTHAGQGSANRRFFFRDAALELIYFRDEEEARSGPGRVIRSLDRYHSSAGSPFGLVFRADDDADLESFPGFPYQPEYFDEGQFFIVGDNVDALDEPSVVLMPRNLPSRPPQKISAKPFESVTEVRVSVPTASLSAALQWAAGIERLTIVPNQAHLMDVVFGNGNYDDARDLRPGLPLLIHW